MADDEYFTLTEARRRGNVTSNKSLYRAVRSGRLKTVTTMAGPQIVRLTTQAWLDDYLASRATGQPAGRTPDHAANMSKPDDATPADPA